MPDATTPARTLGTRPPGPGQRPGAPAAPSSRRAVAGGLVRAARPGQWTKNVLVFAAPGAAAVLDDLAPFLHALEAFGVFCLVASGTYLLNDARDIESDRRHPEKRLRPVAAGEVTVRAAVVAGALLLAGGLAGAFAVTWQLGAVIAVYIGVQVAYSLGLKHQPVYDLACVASGFVLRAIAGGVAVGVTISEWFLIVASFGSLLMVTGKRLAEHTELGVDRGAHRPTLDAYSPTFLRTVLAISAGGAILGYCLWAFSLQSPLLHHHPIWFQLSIAPMLVALLRYTFLVDAGKGARPEQLVLRDRSLLVLGALWAGLFALGVYGA